MVEVAAPRARMTTWFWLPHRPGAAVSPVWVAAGGRAALHQRRRGTACSYCPAFIADAMGLKTVMVKRPMTKAAPAAGRINRQAETPAARMAINSLRRLRLTKAPSTPPRKAKGSSIRITDGVLSIVSQSVWPKPISARTPTVRDCSTKSTSTITVVSTASAAPTPIRAAEPAHSVSMRLQARVPCDRPGQRLGECGARGASARRQRRAAALPPEQR